MARRIFSISLMVILLGIGFSRLHAEVPAQEPSILEEIKLFSKALGAIDQAYVAEVTVRKLLYAAVKGMLDSLDTYSEFIDPEKYKLLQIHMRGEYAGIGAILKPIGDKIFIGAVEPGKPAAIAGLLAGDQIVKIDGKSIEGLGVSDVSGLLRGDENTPVKVTVFRVSVGKMMDIDVIRAKIEIHAIQDERLIGKAIGYFRIAAWQENTAEQAGQATEKLAGQGMKALIIDLRDNDGGLLTAAVALAERFLPKDKKIVSVESKIDEQRKEYYSSGDKLLPDVPVMVLVNGKSASASEVFSAALQDHQRAVILGVKTFGKGSVQSVIPLDEESGMKLTTARYVTPSGRIIDKLGLLPDKIVENGPENTPGNDRQILEAIAAFKEYM